MHTYLAHLASAQDALGQFNDAVTAGTLASELAGVADAAAAGAVRGWVAAQAAALEPHLAKALRRFGATRAFWPT
jgi:CHAD domain-containing protein